MGSNDDPYEHLVLCDMCEEYWCSKCQKHWADCGCSGPKEGPKGRLLNRAEQHAFFVKCLMVRQSRLENKDE